MLELSPEGLLHASAVSKIASGPGSRLHSSAEWKLQNNEIFLSAQVRYQANGFADRLIASSVELAASGKARQSLELWWKLAKEHVAKAVRVAPAPAVQRTLMFEDVAANAGSSADLEEDSDDIDSNSGGETTFVDASSMFESPSISNTSGILEVLEREAQGLQAEVESLEQRRVEL